MKGAQVKAKSEIALRLAQRIEQIKGELQSIGPMRPGSISTQLTACGRAGCRCQDAKSPKKHGPYYQLSYVHCGKSTTQFIRAEFLKDVSAQLENFKRFRALTSEWVDIALTLAREQLEFAKRDLCDQKVRAKLVESRGRKAGVARRAKKARQA